MRIPDPIKALYNPADKESPEALLLMSLKIIKDMKSGITVMSRRHQLELFKFADAMLCTIIADHKQRHQIV